MFRVGYIHATDIEKLLLLQLADIERELRAVLEDLMRTVDMMARMLSMWKEQALRYKAQAAELS